jgi:hypothetical protein
MIRYEDTEVPIILALLKMIRKRDWTGQDTGKFPACANATKGLSPFALIDLCRHHNDGVRGTRSGNVSTS